MFNSQILEVAIGLVFVYLLLCLLCSGIKETVARVLAWRSKTLEDALKNLIENPELIEEIFKNPLIRELKMEKWYHKILNFLPVFKHRGKPTSVSAGSFNMVLFEYLLKKAKGMSRQELENVINALPDSNLKKVLLTLLSSIDTKVTKLEEVLTKLKEGISTWFDDKMVQLSAWYKRKAKVCIFIIAAFVVSFLNVDTFMIANSLYHDSAMRESVVNAAGKMVDAGTTPEAYTGNVEEMIDQFYGEFQLVGLPIGWMPEQSQEKNKDPRGVPYDFRGWLYKVLGLLITSLAVTLGAPFWYQKLRALLQARGGKTPEPAPAPVPAPQK